MLVVSLSSRLLEVEGSCVMWTWIVIGGFSALAGAMMLDDNDPPPPPVQASPALVAQSNSLESVSGAMYWVGGCSVVCSSIGAFTVISLAKLKRKDRR